jgi:hypothetical protein
MEGILPIYKRDPIPGKDGAINGFIPDVTKENEFVPKDGMP